MTSFPIPIPIAATATTPAPAATDRRPSRCTRILLVEDEPVTAGVFAKALKDAGHRVRIAKDGTQAVHALRDHPPDLVVLDMNLPILPGAEILNRIRGAGRSRDIPVVVVSGTERNKTGVDERLLRPGSWLVKPVRPRDLVDTVQTLIESHCDE